VPFFFSAQHTIFFRNLLHDIISGQVFNLTFQRLDRLFPDKFVKIGLSEKNQNYVTLKNFISNNFSTDKIFFLSTNHGVMSDKAETYQGVFSTRTILVAHG
jgi:hypothetical protein